MADPSHNAEHLPLLPEVETAYGELLSTGFDIEEYFAGWSAILLDLRDRLASRPYEFNLRAKEKVGEPRFLGYFTGDVPEKTREFAASAVRYSESVARLSCQWCGRTGWRRADKIVTVACTGCLNLLVAAWDEHHPLLS